MSDKELREYVASIAVVVKETALLLQESEKDRKKERKKNEAERKKNEAERKKNEAERKKRNEAERKKNEAERKKRNEEFEERFRKEEEERKKRDEALSEKIEALSEALSEKIESLWVQIRKTESMMNRFGFNVGSGVEEYFYNTLKSRMSVANIQFEYCERNLKGRNESGEDDEFDIVMKNGTKGVLVECKHRVRKEDVSKMQERKINNFRQSFPGDAKLEMYIALAGISFEPKAEEEAKRAGMILLKQVGERARAKFNVTEEIVKKNAPFPMVAINPVEIIGEPS
ncbi:hypothetical protein CHS0354_000678 [Potamilus streckersoni]|uniref:Uncharacterized protein n=1 Tax=Potamilus streckersoni TaxID=2493646 RepID=A0AAE0T7R9_9BIVA|nr:hypothetical protein CHS0354_000678 [Potamilus streckersoni]